MSLGIAIGCGGRQDLLVDCLRSILDGRARGSTHPVVVMDSGEDPTSDVSQLVTLLGGEVFIHEEQRGISITWNDGIVRALAAGADRVLVLNDDTRLPARFDDDLIRSFPLTEGYPCVCLPDDFTLARWVPDASEKPPPFLSCRMNGAAFVLSKVAIEEVGLFDERFRPPGTCEDYDYWLRLLLTYGPSSIGSYLPIAIFHHRAATLSFFDRAWTEARVAENAARFRDKWKGYESLVAWMDRATLLPWTEPLPPLPMPLPQPEVARKMRFSR